MIEAEDVGELIEGRTSFTSGSIIHMLTEFKYALEHFAKRGQPVRLKGLGIFSPTIDKEGVVSLNFRLDKALKSNLNKPQGFKAPVINRDMIGKSVDDMVERWNNEHPDDKIKKNELAFVELKQQIDK